MNSISPTSFYSLNSDTYTLPATSITGLIAARVINGLVSLQDYALVAGADNSAIVQAALATMTGGGTLLLPAGTTIAMNLNPPAGVTIVGQGRPYNTGVPAATGGAVTGSLLTSNNVDATVISITQNSCGVENVQIVGGGVGSTHPTVSVTNLADHATLRNCDISGGNNAVSFNNAKEFLIDGCFVGQSYGGAAVYCTSAGGRITQSYINQPWNGQFPSFGSTVTAWSQSLVVGVNQLVSLNGWLLQPAAGTSGTTSPTGTGPTVQNYGVPFTDGTVTWTLRAPLAYYGIQWDSSCSVLQMSDTDMSGAHTAGLAMTNTLATGAPQSVILGSNCTSSNFMTNAVLLAAGQECIIDAVRMNQGTLATASVVRATSSWGGDLTISGSTFRLAQYGVTLEGGTHCRVSDCRFGSMTGAALHAAAGVSDFAWVDNDLGGNSVGGTNAVGALVDTGASNWYTIESNDTHGAPTPVSDGGAGTNKRVRNNTQATPAQFQSATFNPTGNATTTRLMQGLGVTYTPTSTGNVLFIVQMAGVNTVAGDGYGTQNRFGTGTPPVNGAAVAGTSFGVGTQGTVPTASGFVPGSSNAFLPGLTVGTTYWFDLSLKALTGAGTATLTNMEITILEV